MNRDEQADSTKCNWCDESVQNHDNICDAMDGSHYFECDDCAANPCAGCEYANPDVWKCAQPFCLLTQTIKRIGDEKNG